MRRMPRQVMLTLPSLRRAARLVTSSINIASLRREARLVTSSINMALLAEGECPRSSDRSLHRPGIQRGVRPDYCISAVLKLRSSSIFFLTLNTSLRPFTVT